MFIDLSAHKILTPFGRSGMNLTDTSQIEFRSSEPSRDHNDAECGRYRSRFCCGFIASVTDHFSQRFETVPLNLTSAPSHGAGGGFLPDL